MDAKVQETLDHLEQVIPREHYELIKALCESYDYLVELARDEDIATDRMREIFCGSTYRQEGRGGHANGSADANQRRVWRRRRRRRARSKKRRSATR